MDEESSWILERFEFDSTLIDRDKITAPMDMGIMEVKALKWRYDKIETVFCDLFTNNDMKELEIVQTLSAQFRNQE